MCAKIKQEHVDKTQKSLLSNHLRPLTSKNKNEINFYFDSSYKIVKNSDNKDFTLGEISYYGWSTARRIIEVELTIKLQKINTSELTQFIITKEDFSSKSTDWFFDRNKRRVLSFKIDYVYLDENGEILERISKGTKTGKAMTTNEDDDDDDDSFLQRFFSL
jgi:hypothetical protein